MKRVCQILIIVILVLFIVIAGIYYFAPHSNKTVIVPSATISPSPTPTAILSPTPTATPELIEKEIKYSTIDQQIEYPNACYIWEEFKKVGYSDACACGILGNMMAEAGGQTLAIQEDIYGGDYYGICQWSLEFFPETEGMSLEKQVQYIIDGLEETFNDYGFISGYTYDEFITMTDPATAALAFAQTYERCDSVSYSQREDNAVDAANYFCADADTWSVG